MPGECSKSTFTGRHEWAVKDDDAVVCHFCRRKATADEAARVLERRDFNQKAAKLSEAIRRDSAELAAITKKNRKKAS